MEESLDISFFHIKILKLLLKLRGKSGLVELKLLLVNGIYTCCDFLMETEAELYIDLNRPVLQQTSVA